MAVEVFAGSAGLSRALTAKGLRAIPFDCAANRQRVQQTCFTADLLTDDGQKVVWDAIKDPSTVYVHLSPPCGHASRSRDLSAGLHDPMSLRSAAYPQGLPGLNDVDATLVAAANSLYYFAADVVDHCCRHGVLTSIENPARSWMWELPGVANVLEGHGLEHVHLHQCMHGGTRAKHTVIAASPGLLAGLRARCDRSHSHAGGDADSGTAYPALLCKRWADCVVNHLVAHGAEPPAQHVEAEPTTSHHHRLRLQATALRQGYRHLPPPLITEFSRVLIADTLSSDPWVQLLRTEFHEGEVGMRTSYVYGVYRSPEQFLEDSRIVEHPFDMDVMLPPVLLKTLAAYMSLGPAEVVMKRSGFLKLMMQKKQEFEQEEIKLSGLPESLQKSLHGKRILLWQWALKYSGFPDENLIEDVVQGFRTMGRLPRSNLYPASLAPAKITEEEFWRRSRWKRSCIRGSTASSGSLVLDRELWAKTLDEVTKGFLEGPFEMHEIDERCGIEWCPIRRFPVQQSDKLRPIDDGKDNGVNDALVVTNKLTLHDVDTLGALLRVIMESVAE
eukprot:5439917-Amphidinium_carterae.1